MRMSHFTRVTRHIHQVLFRGQSSDKAVRDDPAFAIQKVAIKGVVPFREPIDIVCDEALQEFCALGAVYFQHGPIW